MRRVALSVATSVALALGAGLTGGGGEASAAASASRSTGQVTYGTWGDSALPRRWRLFVPTHRDAARRAPLLVLLHGCTQDADDLARGTLVAQPDMAHPGRLREDGVVVLPETVSDLPPVAGILTTGAGNPLSHVQLLARNLGIPNVAIDGSLLPELKRHDGERVVLAVSPAGLVELAADGPRWEAVFGKGRAATDDVVYR